MLLLSVLPGSQGGTERSSLEVGEIHFSEKRKGVQEVLGGHSEASGRENT